MYKKGTARTVFTMRTTEIYCLENFVSFSFVKGQYSLRIGYANTFYLMSLKIIFHHCFIFLLNFSGIQTYPSKVDLCTLNSIQGLKALQAVVELELSPYISVSAEQSWGKEERNLVLLFPCECFKYSTTDRSQWYLFKAKVWGRFHPIVMSLILDMFGEVYQRICKACLWDSIRTC